MYCLGGITRANVLRAARAAGIPAYERDFSLVDVYGADEAFVTGTFAGLTPVMEVDGRRIGHPTCPAPAAADGGAAGPMTRRLTALYRELAAREIVRQ
jgi:branched-chain amino acid aminotransferase